MKKRFLSIIFLSLLIASCDKVITSHLSVESHSFSSIFESEISSEEPSNESYETSISSEVSSYSSEDFSSEESSESSVSYSSISSISSNSSIDSTSKPDDEEDKWNIDLSLRGATFRNRLKVLIDNKRTRTTDYSSCLSIGATAARYPNSNSVRFVPFYHTTNTLTTTSSCNREHTWPNSRGTGKDGPGADPFIIRPTITSDNSSRGNNFYGLGGESAKEWDPASIEFEGARGEAARVILYAATAYYNEGLSLSNNPSDATSLKTMGTLKYLIRWNNNYEPTEMEKTINDRLDSMGYGRNPFIDHPEYANYIWSENGLLNSQGIDETVTYKYDLVNALEDIDNASLVICSKDANNEGYFLTNNAKSDSLPWYLVGVSCSFSSDYKSMSTTYENVSKYQFKKQDDGTYTIYNQAKGVYLYNYIDDSHYSIGLGKQPTNNGSLYWEIRNLDNNSFILYGKSGVYLEYYRGSFCGYSNQPTIGIYLYS